MSNIAKMVRSLGRLSLRSEIVKNKPTVCTLPQPVQFSSACSTGRLSKLLRPLWQGSLTKGSLSVSQTPSQTMASLAQMHKNGPPKKTRFNRQSSLDFCPQKKGVVLKVIIKKPKKPNSANRKCVRVKLTNGRQVVAFVPGEGHNLQEHNMVLVRGGKKQDLPGVKHRVIRGKYDCNHVVKRTV